MLLKVFFIFDLFFLCYSISAQEFNRQEDKYYKQIRIEYSNRQAGVFILKTLEDSALNNPSYFLGLTIPTTLIDQSAFMKDKAVIVFDDNSTIVCSEATLTAHIPPSKQQSYVKHQISTEELEQFKTKKIKSFRLFKYDRSLAKWDKEEIQEAFIKISQMN